MSENRFIYLGQEETGLGPHSSHTKVTPRHLDLRQAMALAETGPAGIRLAETMPICLDGSGWNAVAVGCGPKPEEIGQIFLRKRNEAHGFAAGGGSKLTGSWHKLRDLEKAGAYVPTSWRPL